MRARSQRAVSKFAKPPCQELPFPDGMFDLVTAVETHFWWPDLPGDPREIFRVVKAGGKLILIAEIYKGANTLAARLAEKYADRSPIKLLSVEEHRDLLRNAGFTEIQVVEERAKGWICAFGRKPSYFLTSLPPRFLTSHFRPQ